MPERRALAVREVGTKPVDVETREELSLAAISDRPAIGFLLALERGVDRVPQNMVRALVHVEEDQHFGRQRPEPVRIQLDDRHAADDLRTAHVAELGRDRRTYNGATEIAAPHRLATDDGRGLQTLGLSEFRRKRLGGKSRQDKQELFQETPVFETVSPLRI